MENFNKIISFILGLIVVIVLLVILTGRFNLREKFLPLKDTANVANKSGKGTPTPTPKKDQAKATPIQIGTNQGATPEQTYDYHSYKTPVSQLNKGGVTPAPTGTTYSKGGAPLAVIPNTGAPTALIPFAFSALGAGIYLRKKS